MTLNRIPRLILKVGIYRVWLDASTHYVRTHHGYICTWGTLDHCRRWVRGQVESETYNRHRREEKINRQ